MQLSRRVESFTDSVIRRMTRISDEYDAINLSQGFPDFDPPKELMEALARAAHQGPHQYSITFGAKNFRDALAKKQEKAVGRPIGRGHRLGSHDVRHDDHLQSGG